VSGGGGYPGQPRGSWLSLGGILHGRKKLRVASGKWREKEKITRDAQDAEGTQRSQVSRSIAAAAHLRRQLLLTARLLDLRAPKYDS